MFPGWDEQGGRSDSSSRLTSYIRAPPASVVESNPTLDTRLLFDGRPLLCSCWTHTCNDEQRHRYEIRRRGGGGGGSNSSSCCCCFFRCDADDDRHRTLNTIRLYLAAIGALNLLLNVNRRHLSTEASQLQQQQQQQPHCRTSAVDSTDGMNPRPHPVGGLRHAVHPRNARIRMRGLQRNQSLFTKENHNQGTKRTPK